ncbi:MAG: hypothetical protein ABIR06_05735 [Cyclobacteriaceae bacterium]
MNTTSFVYRNIFIYRFMMDILYLGKYKKRFTAVIRQIRSLPPDSRILELCFADIHIAAFCKKEGYHWEGFDINKTFVGLAKSMGFNARCADLTKLEVFPKADVCIMMGSFYHFYPETKLMLRKILNAAEIVVISEPVYNLSNNSGIVGFLARRAANAGKGHETFRFNKQSFITMLEENSVPLGYSIAVIQDVGKDSIVKLIKNESHRP